MEQLTFFPVKPMFGQVRREATVTPSLSTDVLVRNYKTDFWSLIPLQKDAFIKRNKNKTGKV